MSRTSAPATVFENVDALRGAVGQELGVSDWLEITQERIDAFADATGDHQWIHVDPARAATESPFGGTIAHGYLTLSLISHFLPSLVEVRNIAMGINYGADRVRFPAPVPVGSRIRARAQLTDVTEVTGGVQTTMTVSVEIEDGTKPACVVDILSRFISS